MNKNYYLLLFIPLFSFCSPPKESQNYRIVPLDREKMVIAKEYNYRNYDISVYPELIMKGKRIVKSNIYMHFPYDSTFIYPASPKHPAAYFCKYYDVQVSLNNHAVGCYHTKIKCFCEEKYNTESEKAEYYEKLNRYSYYLQPKWMGRCFYPIPLPMWIKITVKKKINIGDTLEIKNLYNCISIPIDTCQHIIKSDIPFPNSFELFVK